MQHALSTSTQQPTVKVMHNLDDFFRGIILLYNTPTLNCRIIGACVQLKPVVLSGTDHPVTAADSLLLSDSRRDAHREQPQLSVIILKGYK